MAKPTWARTNGFSKVGTIVVVVIVAVVFLGVLQSLAGHKSNKTQQPTTNQSTGKQESGGSSTATSGKDLTEGGKYLVIKQWGVRFELPENLRRKVFYGIEKISSNGRETAWFEISTFSALPDSTCGLSEISSYGNTGKIGGIGAFIIKSETPVSTGEAAAYDVVSPNMPLKDALFTGAYSDFAANCANDQSRVQAAQDAARSLAASFAHLQESPQ